PSHCIQIAKETCRFRIPAPPEIARKRPQTFLDGRYKAIEHSRPGNDGRHLRRRLDQHAHFIFVERTRLYGLHNEHTLEHAAIDQRHSDKRLVRVFAGFTEVLESWMISR